jgi:hypothetical protein
VYQEVTVPTNAIRAEFVADLALLTEEQAGELLTLHPNTLKRQRRKGTGPKVTVLSDGRIAYRAKHLREWIEERTEVREADMESFELPPAEERAEVGLETLPAEEAIRHRDFDKLNEILLGSRHPAKRHAIEAMVLCAFLINRDEDPERLVAELRARIADPPTD